MTTCEKIETLRRMLEEATPGPWYEIPHPEWSSAPHRIDTRPDVPHENFGELGRMGAKNAALVVAAINSLPALLDVAEAADHYINTVEIEEGQAIALLNLRHSLAQLMTAPFWIEK